MPKSGCTLCQSFTSKMKIRLYYSVVYAIRYSFSVFLPLTSLYADTAVSWDCLSSQMKNRRNYYRILDVQPDAPAEVIQSSYRTLMQQLNAHPDPCGDTSQAALINQAYAVLSNSRKRAEHDHELKQQYTFNTRLDEQVANSSAPAMSLLPGICPFCSGAHQYENDIPSDAFCPTCKSPLYLAERQCLEKFDQCKIDRIGKQTALSYFTCWPQLRPYRGITDNISTHGMTFKTTQQVPVDSVIRVNCTQFQTIACVVNCSQAGNNLCPDWHVGVKFLTLYFRSSRGVFVSDTT